MIARRTRDRPRSRRSARLHPGIHPARNGSLDRGTEESRHGENDHRTRGSADRPAARGRGAHRGRVLERRGGTLSRDLRADGEGAQRCTSPEARRRAPQADPGGVPAADGRRPVRPSPRQAPFPTEPLTASARGPPMPAAGALLSTTGPGVGSTDPMADGPRKPRIRGRRIIERPPADPRARPVERSRADAGRRAPATERRCWRSSGLRGTSAWSVGSALDVGGRRRRDRSGARTGVRTRSLAAPDGACSSGWRSLPIPSARRRSLAEMLAEDLGDWPESGWVVIDDYQHLAASTASERFVATIVECSPVRILIASRVRPSWVAAKSILDGRGPRDPPDGARDERGRGRAGSRTADARS